MNDITSRLDDSIVQAYKETHYQVHGEPAFVLRVGSVSVELRDLYRSHGYACAAYLTAWNPYSQLSDEAENFRRQAALQSDLAQRQLPIYSGEGRDPKGEWPGEPSFLVLGLSRADGEGLARAYEQNAFLWCGEEGHPELVLMR